MHPILNPVASQGAGAGLLPDENGTAPVILSRPRLNSRAAHGVKSSWVTVDGGLRERTLYPGCTPRSRGYRSRETIMQVTVLVRLLVGAQGIEPWTSPV